MVPATREGYVSILHIVGFERYLDEVITLWFGQDKVVRTRRTSIHALEEASTLIMKRGEEKARFEQKAVAYIEYRQVARSSFAKG